MCQREDLGIELEHMEWSNFTTVVDKLGNGENITLTGWGELSPTGEGDVFTVTEFVYYGGEIRPFHMLEFDS